MHRIHLENAIKVLNVNIGQWSCPQVGIEIEIQINLRYPIKRHTLYDLHVCLKSILTSRKAGEYVRKHEIHIRNLMYKQMKIDKLRNVYQTIRQHVLRRLGRCYKRNASTLTFSFSTTHVTIGWLPAIH